MESLDRWESARESVPEPWSPAPGPCGWTGLLPKMGMAPEGIPELPRGGESGPEPWDCWDMRRESWSFCSASSWGG